MPTVAAKCAGVGSDVVGAASCNDVRDHSSAKTPASLTHILDMNTLAHVEGLERAPTSIDDHLVAVLVSGRLELVPVESDRSRGRKLRSRAAVEESF